MQQIHLHDNCKDGENERYTSCHLLLNFNNLKIFEQIDIIVHIEWRNILKILSKDVNIWFLIDLLDQIKIQLMYMFKVVDLKLITKDFIHLTLSFLLLRSYLFILLQLLFQKIVWYVNLLMLCFYPSSITQLGFTKKFKLCFSSSYWTYRSFWENGHCNYFH